MTDGRARAGRIGLPLVLILVASPFIPALLTGRTLYYRDVGQLHLPNRALTARMLGQGELPLWNPHRGNGQPFLANPNSLVLRPTTPLFLLFPPDKVQIPLVLSVVLLSLIAAAGTWGLLRDAGLCVPAAAGGAVAFALSGPLQSLGQVLNHLEGVAWIPVVLWLLNRALSRGWRPWAILAGFAASMVLSAGEPVWVLTLALACLALPGLRSAGARRASAVAGGVAVLAVLVAAIQLLPLADLAGRSARAEGLPAELHLKWSVPPAALLQTVLPGLWGDPARANPSAYWGAGLFDSSLPWMPSLHLGAPVLALAVAGACRSRDRWRRAAAALCLAAGLLALGRHVPPLAAALGWLPGFSSLRYPVKWFLLVAWCASLLAAAGLEDLIRPGRGGAAPSGSRIALLACGAVLLPAGLLSMTAAGGILVAPLRALLAVPEVIGDSILAGGAVPAIGRSAVLAGGTLLLVAIASPSTGQAGDRRWLAAAAVGLAVLAGAWHLNPTAPPETVFERSPLLDAMPEAMAGGKRFVGLPRPRGFAFRTPSPSQAEEAGLTRDSLAWGLRWDVRTLRFATPYPAGLFGAYDQRGEALLDLRPGSSVAERIAEGVPLQELVRYMRVASAGFLLAYGEVDHPSLAEVASLRGESNVPARLYALRDPLPRVYVVDRAIPVRSPAQALEGLRAGELDAGLAVYVEGPASGPPVESSGEETAGRGTARVVADRPNSVLVSARAARGSWLVLTDTFDPSWRARVDGEPVEILRANGMFRAVRVPAGEHEIRFEYRPASFYAGAALSLISLAAGVVLLATGRGRRTCGRRLPGAP